MGTQAPYSSLVDSPTRFSGVGHKLAEIDFPFHGISGTLAPIDLVCPKETHEVAEELAATPQDTLADFTISQSNVEQLNTAAAIGRDREGFTDAENDLLRNEEMSLFAHCQTVLQHGIPQQKGPPAITPGK